MSKYPNSLDLNKIFQLSYNFDLLKSLLENLINNQKDFENQLMDININLKKVTGDEASVQKLIDARKSLETNNFIIAGGTTAAKTVVNDGITLEESPELDPLTNNIIVSNKFYNYL